MILSFSKERPGAYFCPTYHAYIGGGVLSRIYGLDSICRFYCICSQFVLHLSVLLHLWGYCICGFILFLVITAIKSGKLVKKTSKILEEWNGYPE